MELFLDICQGIGLACAAGIRPFLPAIVAGLYATLDWGVDFEDTSFAFLEHPVWLAGIGVLLALSLLWRSGGASDLAEGAVGGIGLTVGALLFAGTLADHGYDSAAWLAASVVAGTTCALMGHAVFRRLVTRTPAPLASPEGRTGPLSFDGVGLALAVLSVLVPPIALVAMPVLAWLLVRDPGPEG